MRKKDLWKSKEAFPKSWYFLAYISQPDKRTTKLASSELADDPVVIAPTELQIDSGGC